MTNQQNKWNADAEAAAMGFVVPIESEEHVKHVLAYILRIIHLDKKDYDAKSAAEEVFNDAHEFCETPISHISINRWAIGGDKMTMITLVEDDQMQSLTDEDGVLAYVYNVSAPDLSELGYVFFKKDNGRIHRIG